MGLSVTIITLNEERNIRRAIESALFAQEIILLDSFSQDKTLELARAYPTVKVFQEKFVGFGQQKNRAQELASNDWIFSLDADEEISPQLQQSILKIMQDPKAFDLYQVDRLTSFRGQWIKHGGWSPDWLPRMYKKGKAHFTTPPVHENLILNSPQSTLGNLSGHLLHHSFESFESQVLTNLKYAKYGAMKLHQGQKSITLMHLILRPFWKFIECYFLKLGLLDGKAGLLIAFNASYSQFMKYALADEQSGQSSTSE